MIWKIIVAARMKRLLIFSTICVATLLLAADQTKSLPPMPNIDAKPVKVDLRSCVAVSVTAKPGFLKNPDGTVTTYFYRKLGDYSRLKIDCYR